MSIKYNSWREVVEADLARLPDKMQEGALEALNDAADFMIIIAHGHCPVDTGTLQGSIRKEQEGQVVRVLAGGYQFINPRTNRPCTYAVYVEAHTPFMRPAFESIRHFILERIRLKVLETAEKLR